MMLTEMLDENFRSTDEIVSLSFDYFIMKNGERVSKNFDQVTINSNADMTILSIFAKPHGIGLDIIYHPLNGQYRIELKGLPVDNIEAIGLTIERSTPDQAT